MNQLKNNLLPDHFKSLEDEFVMDLLFGFGIETNINPLLKTQTGGSQNGGSQTEYQKFIDIGGVYTYEIYKENIDDDRLRISVITPIEQDCITIFIFKNKNIAVLHNMSYMNDCAKEGLGKPGSGNKLLRFALNLIVQYADKYKIKRIILKDNSFLHCRGCSETIKLANLRLITHGKPWYSSYGFKPYDASTHKPSKSLLKSVGTTNNLLDDIKTMDVNMIDLIRDIIKKEKLKNINMKEMKILIKKNPLIRNFIIRLAKEFDKYCCIIHYILKVIYNPETKLGLTNFYNKNFYLDI